MRKIILACSIVLAMFAAPAFPQDEELLKGVRLYREEKFQDAADVLQMVVEKEPENDIAWTYLGGSLENLGKHRKARIALKKKGKDKDSPLKYEKELQITGTQKAKYTDDAALQMGLQGNVVLAVEFKADGTIGFIVVLHDLSPGLTKSAIKATRAITFRPAVADGKPVPVIRPVSYDFLIR